MLSEKAKNPKGKAEIAMRQLVADWPVVASIPKRWLVKVNRSEGVSGLKAIWANSKRGWVFNISLSTLTGCVSSRSRMNREVHIRFWERFGGEIPPYLLDCRLSVSIITSNVLQSVILPSKMFEYSLYDNAIQQVFRYSLLIIVRNLAYCWVILYGWQVNCFPNPVPPGYIITSSCLYISING